MRRVSLQTLFLVVALVASVALVVGVVLVYENPGLADNPSPRSDPLTLEQIPFNGTRAYDYLKQICEIGPRPSASPGMAEQQKLLIDHFEKLGGKVKLQQFRIRHPLDGSETRMANLIASWHPERKNRILLAAHYDTRPFPSQDPVNPRGKFIGANDGASGVALLMELAHHMGELDGKLGVDFVLFDGEEFIFDDERDLYFLGSEYFAREYAAGKIPAKYRWAVVLDMVADADLRLFLEKRGWEWPDSRPLAKQIWQTAAKLGVTEFIMEPKYELRDDHLPLHETGKIPAIDIIDFEYPRQSDTSGGSYWHTEQDTPDKCSALSLAKVGWVVNEWLKQAVGKGK